MVVGQFSQEVDVLIIGGGPAGYTAAFRSAELGKNVAIVDPHETLGGRCLHQACIPTKGAYYGHGIDEVAQYQTKLKNGLEQRCKLLGIERLIGNAHFESAKKVQITGEHVSIVKFRKAIIATGTSPREPLNDNCIQVEDVYQTDSMSGKVLIIGGTTDGVEAADALKDADVTLCTDGQLLPSFDERIVKLVERQLKKVATIVHELPDLNDFEHIVLATKRMPQLNAVQLQNANVQFDEHGIHINESCQTSQSRVYAVGDCTDACSDASVAIAQGTVAAEAACGLDSVFDAQFIPQVCWGSPEFAQCGEFNKEVVNIKWGQSGLALLRGMQQGTTFLGYCPDSQYVTGVGFIGDDATELISEGALALEMGATLYDLAQTIRPHPTRCELLGVAAKEALKQIS